MFPTLNLSEDARADKAPAPFLSRQLTDTDDDLVLTCVAPQVVTVNAGLKPGFGCMFRGPVSFSGTATVADLRTAGAASNWCALVQVGADAYDAIGGVS